MVVVVVVWVTEVGCVCAGPQRLLDSCVDCAFLEGGSRGPGPPGNLGLGTLLGGHAARWGPAQCHHIKCPR
jgi:hypothetical protein